MGRDRRKKVTPGEMQRRHLEGVTVLCPECDIRIPANQIEEHLASKHPKAAVDVEELIKGVPVSGAARTNTMKAIGNTKGKSTKPRGKPVSGGLPGLGRSRKN